MGMLYAIHPAPLSLSTPTTSVCCGSSYETPKGSRNKFAFNSEEHIFELKKVLPAGWRFPYDFGFVPSTEADDWRSSRCTRVDGRAVVIRMRTHLSPLA